MCGIAGLWPLSGSSPAQEAILDAMGQAIAHRGPDSAASSVLAGPGGAPGVGLVHRRLAILDLSSAGNQPMASASGRYTLVYNGEIYNHLELRNTLTREGRAPDWRGHSDTETLLAAIEAWGLAAALGALRGMFALALWDHRDGTLSLARDALGEKPLYYGRAVLRGGPALIFASELAAFFALPGFSPEIDPNAAHSLLTRLCIPAPASVFKGISKLRPGHMVTLPSPDAAPREEAFWLLTDVIARTAEARATPRDAGVMRADVEEVLTRVIADQRISDVPLGVFLSGGIDSSLITALMVAGVRAEGGDATMVRSYSIGFEEARFNEAEAAAAVASHLGTKHTTFIVGEREALCMMEDLGRVFSEPFADSSQIPTALLARMARRDVTVALSGDGGDEMFGGYNRHVIGPWLWRRLARLPLPLRRAAEWAMAAPGALLAGEGPAGPVQRALSKAGLPVTTLVKLRTVSRGISASDFAGFYGGLVSGDGRLAEPEPGLPGFAGDSLPRGVSGGLHPAEQMMAWDALWYLPDDIMVKVDRSAMAASLETRAPFLDPLAVEAAWSLPIGAKIAGGKGKSILRDILYNHVPRPLIDRPKQGFAVPLDAWLRGPLRDWAGDHLAAGVVPEAAGLDPQKIARLWQAHQSGRVDAGGALWPVVMLSAWAAQWMQNSKGVH
jgi:asparagine synthase (glutamine-hydrolysing)